MRTGDRAAHLVIVIVIVPEDIVMLARIRKAQQDNEGGFTLIELLVVMIIIGILAAIAIPAFLNQRGKARESSAKADVNTIGKEIATYYVDGTLGLTAASATLPTWTLTEAGGTTALTSGRLSTGNKIVASTITNATTYCVVVQSGFAADGTGTSTDKAWRFNQNGLTQAAAC